MIKLGYLYAYIGGDRRYGSRIEVILDTDDSCRIELSESSPVGGMDGPGGTHPFEVRKTKIVPKNPHSIVKAIKEMINDEPDQVIKRYGKPSKNFRFEGAKKSGLNVHACKQALGIDD